MKEDLLNKIVVTMVTTVLLTSLHSEGQTMPVIAGCKQGAFVQGVSSNQVATVGKSYSPKCLKIKVGDSVTIEASQHHPLFAMSEIEGVENPFSSSSKFISSQTRIMNTPGLFGYYCDAHGNSQGGGMAGVILVE